MFGNPASAIVGTSGRAGERLGAITARALTLPALTCVAMPGTRWNITDTSPDSSEVVAGPAPLKGTWVIEVWVAWLNSSAAVCIELPLPVVAKLVLPGFFFR